MSLLGPERLGRIAVLLTSLLLAATAGAEITPDAKVVVDRFIAATGGAAAIAEVQSTRVQATISAFGLEGTSLIYTRRPNQRASVTEIGPLKIRDGFDGKTAWRTDHGTGKVVTLDGKDLEDAKSSTWFDNDLWLLPDQGGGKVTVAGEERDSTGSYTVLEVTPPLGNPRRMLFNRSTGLLDRITTKRDQLTLVSNLSDYRVAGKRKIAYGQTTQVVGMPANDLHLTVDSVWVNEPLPDSLFGISKQRAKAVRWLKTKDVAKLPFDYRGRHVWIRASVNGGPPADFIFDTGASVTVIDSSYAAGIGLERMGSLQAQGAGSAGGASLSTLKSLRVAGPDGDGVELENVKVALLKLNDFLAPFFWHDCAGVVGYDFISRFVTEIDFDAERLTLHEPESFAYAGTGARIPFELATTVPVIEMKLDGRYSGRFRVDVGSGATVDLHGPFVKQHDLANQTTGGIEVTGGGFGGTFKSRLVRMKKLEIGPYAWEKPLVSLSMAEGGAFTSEDYAGNIGTQILERFKVILDYDRRELILEPGKQVAKVDRFSRAGVQLAKIGKSIRAMEVLDGSPAAQAGLQDGDEVVAIEGKPVLSYTADDVETLFDDGKIGRKIALEVSRGGKKETLTLTLRDLL